MSIEKTRTYKRTAIFDQVSIAASATTSSTFDCGGMQLQGLILPSGWTTCDLTFKASPVSGSSLTFVASPIQICDGSTLSTLTIPGTVAGQWIALLPYWFSMVPYLQIVCSTNQVSAVNVQLALQPLYQGIHG